MGTIPKWEDIEKDSSFTTLDPEKRNRVRQRWLSDVYAKEQKWTNEQRLNLRQIVYQGEDRGVFSGVSDRFEAAKATGQSIVGEMLEENKQQQLAGPPAPEQEQLGSPTQQEEAPSLLREMTHGPGTKQFLEDTPGGRYIYEEEREEFAEKPWLPSGLSEEQLLQRGEEHGLLDDPDTKVGAIVDELKTAAEWYVLGKGFQAGGKLLKHMPRLNNLIRKPRALFKKGKAKIAKEADEIIRSIMGGGGEGLSSGERGIVKELESLRDTLVPNFRIVRKKLPIKTPFKKLKEAPVKKKKAISPPPSRKGLPPAKAIAVGPQKPHGIPGRKMRIETGGRQGAQKALPAGKPTVPMKVPAKTDKELKAIVEEAGGVFKGTQKITPELKKKFGEDRVSFDLVAGGKSYTLHEGKSKVTVKRIKEILREKMAQLSPEEKAIKSPEVLAAAEKDIQKRLEARLAKRLEAEKTAFPTSTKKTKLPPSTTVDEFMEAGGIVTQLPAKGGKTRAKTGVQAAKDALNKAIADMDPKGTGVRKGVKYSGEAGESLGALEDTLGKIDTGTTLDFMGMQTGYNVIANAIRSGVKVIRRPAIKKGKSHLMKGAPEDALKTERMFNKQDKELERVLSPGLKKIYNTIAKVTWDTSFAVKKALIEKGGKWGKTALIDHDLVRGAPNKGQIIIREIEKRLYKGLGHGEEEVLNRIIQARRTITIKRYKPEHLRPEGLGAKENQAYLDNLPPKLLDKLDRKADVYFSEMRKVLDRLLDEGLLTKAQYAGLSQKGVYSPSQYIKFIDPHHVGMVGGKAGSVADSGLKALTEGSMDLLNNDSRRLLAETIGRTEARIFKNKANKSLYEMAVNVPDNGIARLAKEGETAKGGFQIIKAMVDGKPKSMIMPDEYAKDWLVNDPLLNELTTNIINWGSGSRVLKAMATGMNPEFMLTNFPRDLAHIFLTTTEYSKHLPISALQMGRDLSVTAFDALGRKGRWLEYISDGGGMELLTHQGFIPQFKHARTPLKRGTNATIQGLEKTLSYLGETSEIWTRLALRQRAIRNGASRKEASWTARNYLDFQQNGNLVKAVDSGVPYLNAAVQGTRGIFRAAGREPGTFTYKVAQIGTLAAGLYWANKNVNPEVYDNISPREKVNNWIITLPFEPIVDKTTGDKHYIYGKIAKDQGQRIFATLFEGLVAKYQGDDMNWDEIAMAAEELVPLTKIWTDPFPMMDVFKGYATNTDFWRNDKIWRGPKVEPTAETDKYTHPAFTSLAPKLGLSPKRTQHSLQQLFTQGNIYTSVVGGGWRLLTNEVSRGQKREMEEKIIQDVPFLRRLAKTTQPYTQFQKKVEKEKITSNTRRFAQTQRFDDLAAEVYEGKASRQEIKRFIRKEPREDRKRLIQRFKYHKKLVGVPDKRWWLNLIGATPEARAILYQDRYSGLDAAGKRELESQMRRIPRFRSKDFWRKVKQLRKSRGKKGLNRP